ncbi:PREDICTED: putative inorganic phosphate cotransporter isoform X2 [Nicrophorus vespilloides]|uniref:Inorganic phosphate cotransporter isoform X2 n=1 Tax=Nicrophorus vespilloides TaxID=110193 RepID=A0ABM1MJ56_NICVS|nr:PREDICTED: putative inorganic phosphate cotransporter isoform X2 [Nicrophorus vespilloides]
MLTGWRLTLSKCFVIPQRYIVGIMGFLAVVNAYTMRICLSIAILDIVEEEDHKWDRETQGLVKSAFYFGYVITHLPGGILAERFGGKYTLGIGILSTAFFTLLTPVVVEWGDWPGLLVLRILQGLGEGTTYPALNSLLSKWVPIHERAKMGTLVYAGGQIGTVVGNTASGFLIKAAGTWTSVFYMFGGIGVLWFVLWTLLCYSEPSSHPFISDDEKNFLRKELGSNEQKSNVPTPWKAILTSVPLWSLVAAQIGHDWGFFTMVTDLPNFMSDVLHLQLDQNGIWSSVPYIVMWIVSMSSGWLCDWLIQKDFMKVTFARKFFTAIAAIGPGIFIVVAAYAGNDQTTVIALFTVGMGFMGTFYCGMKVNALDLSPNYAGTLMAIVNGIGAITGIITPYLSGAMTPNHDVEEWRIVFWVSFVVFTLTTFIYVMWGSAEEQWWNTPEKGNPNAAEKDPKAMVESGNASTTK